MKKIDLKNTNEPWLIVTDLDGTFLANTPNMAIPAKNIQAVKKLNKLGHHFIMASGRSPHLMIFNHKYLELQTPMVCFHGAYITDPTGIHQSMTIIDEPMKNETVKKLLKKIDMFNIAKSIHMIGIGRSIEISDEADIEQFDFDPYEGVILSDLESEIDIEALSNVIEDNFGEEISFKFIEGGSGLQENLLLFMSKGTDKVNALKKLSKYYNIPQERIMYFGDNYNDIEAIKWAGVGICVESGMQKVKDISDFIAPGTNHEGAVGKFILELLK